MRILREVTTTVVGVVIVLGIVGCATDRHSDQSALAPAGPAAQAISSLTWLFMVVCAVVFVLVTVVLAGALLHRRRGAADGPGDEPITRPDAGGERRLWAVVSGAVVVTVVALFVLLLSDFATGRTIHKLSAAATNPLRIQVIGHQWWWEVRYDDWPDRFGERVPSNAVTTANEIHIPVDPNEPVDVELRLDSHDVIHSFWVPNLHGKRDLVPGHATSLWLRADRPGTYWGECGEYCGYQHAQMRLAVVAEPVENFRAWLAAQRETPGEPKSETESRGRQVFLHTSCAMCHAVQGTEARGNLGPDLTHVGGRLMLGAGAVANVRGNLAGWIVDPQGIKPGCRMPQNNLDPFDLRALLDYLEALK